MARDARKFVKVSVLLTIAEYADLRAVTTQTGSNHSWYIRAALREKIQKEIFSPTGGR